MYYMIVIITLISATLYFTSPATRMVMETLQTDDRVNVPKYEIANLRRHFIKNISDVQLDELLHE